MGSNLSAANFLEKLHKFWRQRFSQALSGLYLLPGFAVFLLIIIGLGPPGVGQGIRFVSFRVWVKSAMARAHRPWARYASPRNLGVAYAIKGRFEEAIARYQEAIQIDGNFVETYNNLGIIYGNQGKNREAIAMFQKVVQT
jgi:tetratricopeptide (TPR) repeat protein